MTDSREAPTTGNGHIDLSVSRPRTSAPLGSPAEHALFHAYRYPAPVTVEQPCACGGVIRARFEDWPAIFNAIGAHNELTIHRLWRTRYGL